MPLEPEPPDDSLPSYYPLWLRDSFRFTVKGASQNIALSSRWFDQVLSEALAGDVGRLERLNKAYERKMAGNALLGRGVNAFDAWAYLRAMRAAMECPVILKRMSSLGVLVRAREPNAGYSIVHGICLFSAFKSMLLEALKGSGVDIEARDFEGHTALEIAEADGDEELAAVLTNLGRRKSQR